MSAWASGEIASANTNTAMATMRRNLILWTETRLLPSGTFPAADEGSEQLRVHVPKSAELAAGHLALPTEPREIIVGVNPRCRRLY